MYKELTRDSATDAYRFYALIERLTAGGAGKVPDRYRAMLTADLLRPREDARGSGVSKPTEAAVLACERRLDLARAAILDLEAVERVLAWAAVQRDGAELMETMREVWMTDVHTPIGRHTIRDRAMRYASTKGYVSGRTVWRRLKKLRIRWAEERGLRIFPEVG